MKVITTIFLLLICYLAPAQFMQDVTGRPYVQMNSNEYEGSPLLFSTWVKADVKASYGIVYKDMLVNVDVSQDMPIFFRDNAVFAFSETINEITINDSSSRAVLKRGKLISTDLPNVFFEIVNESPMLLKRSDRNVVEVPSYGNSNKEFRYVEIKSYYIQFNNEYQKISLNKENAQKLFAKHWKQTEDYAKKNAISFKTEVGWRQLASYYKTLKS